MNACRIVSLTFFDRLRGPPWVCLSQPSPCGGLPGHGPGSGPALIQLVVVQMSFDLDDYWSRDAFAAKIRRLMQQVARESNRNCRRWWSFPKTWG